MQSTKVLAVIHERAQIEKWKVQSANCKRQAEKRSRGEDDAGADGVSTNQQAAEALEDGLPEFAQVNRHRQVK